MSSARIVREWSISLFPLEKELKTIFLRIKFVQLVVVSKREQNDFRECEGVGSMKTNIHEAYLFGVEKHKGQKDDEGNDYFESHCMHVVKILEEVTKNPRILIAGLLHDVLEDTNTTYEELYDNFGVDIAYLVYEVTHEGKADEHGFYFPRLQSKEAIMIKFADRLSNLSRIGGWDKKRQEHYFF